MQTLHLENVPTNRLLKNIFLHMKINEILVQIIVLFIILEYR